MFIDVDLGSYLYKEREEEKGGIDGGRLTR